MSHQPHSPHPQAFYADPAVHSLRQGVRPAASGIVLVAGWSWGKTDDCTIGPRYKDIAEAATNLDPACYTYPPQHLHCTVATLSSFNNEKSPFFNASDEDQLIVLQAWGDALDRAFRKARVLRPFDLTFSDLGWSSAAAYLLAEDPSDMFRELRAAVRLAAEDSQVAEAEAKLTESLSHVQGLVPLREALRVPDIIHSTIMRFSSEPLNPARLASDLDDLGEKWRRMVCGEEEGRGVPVTIRVTSLSLVHERHPYMHIGLGEGEARRFLLDNAAA
ncbi:unnamed protein product [Choristocarpus tenellus]